MIRQLGIAVSLAAIIASTPARAGDPAAGLQALKDYNLIVLGDITIGHDVEGKTLIGGNLQGNGTVGIGNGSQGQAASSAPTLTVGGNVSNANLNINNGSNGGGGTIATGPGIAVGGNVTNSNLNLNGSSKQIAVGGNLSGNPNVNAGDTLLVGGNTTGILNINGGTVQIGGSALGGANFNGGTFQQNLGAGFASGIVTPISSTVAQVADDVKALSSALAAFTLGSNPSFLSAANGGQQLVLNAVGGGNDFALFNFAGSLFNAYSEMSYNFPSTALPVIVNVSGTAINFGLNPVGGNNAFANQQIIWNFYEATSLNFTTMFHGSVLAPFATLTNNTPIEGSVAVAGFNQGGEVHLGTFNLDLRTQTAVPEPATWAMMIAGFGLVGAAMRRRTLRPRPA